MLFAGIDLLSKLQQLLSSALITIAVVPLGTPGILVVTMMVLGPLLFCP
jgi:hypothetical protein